MEFDDAMRTFARGMRLRSAPRARILHVARLHAAVRTVPEAWLTSYASDFIPALLQLARLPGLEGFEPQVWESVLALLDAAARLGWSSDTEALARARSAAAGHLLLSHAYAGSLRHLDAALVARGLAHAALHDEGWIAVFGAGATPFAMFSSYVAVRVQSADSLATEGASLLRDLHEHWSELRMRGAGLFTILLESGGGRDPDDAVDGVVAPLEIDSLPGPVRVQFGHAIAEGSAESLSQLERALRCARMHISERCRTHPPPRTLHVHFRDLPTAVTGGSLGLAAAAGFTIRLSQMLNRRTRWSASGTVALIGSLDADGRVESAPWEFIEAKLRAAVYSPVETIVLHAEHREAALALVQELTRELPNRALRIIGVATLRECLEHTEAIRMESRTPYDRAAAFIAAHPVPVLVAVLLVALSAGAWFAWKAWYDYPDLEHALGLKVSDNAIVYNPKDSLTWCFRDHLRVIEPELPFGDLEVGDGFTRNLFLWNMTPFTLRAELAIEGPDAGEWYLNWKDGVQEIPAADSIRFSVMFAPLHAKQGMRAALVLRDPDSHTELYRVALTGAAGEPLPAGYALHLDGRRAMMYFGPRSTVFDRDCGTFECWLKPLSTKPMVVLINDINPPDGAALHSFTLAFDSLNECSVCVGSIATRIPLDREHRLRIGAWSHVAVAFDALRGKVRVFIDGDELFAHDGTPFVFESKGMPHITLGAYNNGNDRITQFAPMELDGVRVWSRMLSRDDVHTVMHRRMPVHAVDVPGCWEFDAMCEVTAFSSDQRAHNADLPGHPSYVRSDAPIVAEPGDVRTIPGPHEMSAVESGPGRFLECNRSVLPRFTDATISFWYRAAARPSGVFGYITNSFGPIQFFDFQSGLLVLDIAEVPPRHRSRAGWNHVAFVVRRDGTLTAWLNGDRWLQGRLATPVHTPGLRDWLHRFEGMQFGWTDDAYNSFGEKTIGSQDRWMNQPTAYAGIAVWTRLLNEEEIRALYSGNPAPQAGLAAHWTLDTPPDANLNFVDAVSGYLLHVRRPQPRTVESYR